MPSLRMKAKPITGLREQHGLHVCRKSTKVSTDCSRLKTSQQPGILDNNTRFSQDAHAVISNFDFSDEYTKISGVVDLRVCCGGSLDQNVDMTLGLPDIASAGRTGFQSTTILETLFSPIITYEDTPADLKADRDAVDQQAELPRLIADDNDEGSSSPSNLQSCNESDSRISNISDPHIGVSFIDGSGLPDLTNTTTDRDCVNSQIMVDTEDRYILLPCHEKKLEAINVLDYSREQAKMNMDDSYLFLAIHQLKPPSEEIKCCFQSPAGEEVDCFDPRLFIGNLPDVIEEVSPPFPNLLSDVTKRQKPITLVLDLDETLVHSTLDHCEDADFTFPVFLNMKEHTVYVRQRPHLHIFLERVAEMFEIVIFTASQSVYAERLLDILDPNKKLISQRMYRESCTFSGGSYTKDLTILGIDLARVAIIDNSPQVFQLQVNNGIPIKSWFDDPLDCALISLLPFLETLAEADDVRPLIAKKFSNKEE